MTDRTESLNGNTPPQSNRISFFKACTWRLVASTTTYLVALGLTGKNDVAISIMGLESFIKIGVYFLHEKAWLVYATDGRQKT